jgi:hypothetical protein
MRQLSLDLFTKASELPLPDAGCGTIKARRNKEPSSWITAAATTIIRCRVSIVSFVVK